MSYAACLAHPFAPEAFGAQVPDEFAFPTETCVYRNIFKVLVANTDTALYPASSAAVGSGCFVVQPNLFATIAAAYGSSCLADPLYGGNVWFRSDATPIAEAIKAGFPGINHLSGFSEHGVTTQAEIEERFSSYRLVGWGVRVKPVGTANDAQGTLYLCKVPSKEEFALYTSEEPSGYRTKSYATDGSVVYATAEPSWSPHATFADYCNYYNLPGVDETGMVSTSLKNHPASMDCQYPELFLEGGIEVAGKHSSSSCTKWRDTDASSAIASKYTLTVGGTNYLTANAYGQPDTMISVLGSDDVVDNANSYAISGEFLAQGGWSAIVCRGNGFPAEGGFVDVEVIFHVEGVARIKNVGYVSNSSKFPPVNPPMVDIARAYAHSLPIFKKVKKVAGGVSGLYQKLDSISRNLGLGSASGVLQRAAMTGLPLL